MKIRLIVLATLVLMPFTSFAGQLSGNCTDQMIGNSTNYLKQTRIFISGVEQEAEFTMNYTHGPYMINPAFIDGYLAALKIRSGLNKLRKDRNSPLDKDEVSTLTAICQNAGHLDFGMF